MARFVMRYKRFLLPTLAIAAGLALWAGCQTAKVSPAPPLTTSLQPGPNDPRIAFWTARLLEGFHYRQQPLDREMSEKTFDAYIDSLDPRHENFLQSDLAEFAMFRTNLDRLIMGGGSERGADLTPAFLIYDRYRQRFQQHNTEANALLRQDRFKFNSAEKIQLDRRHAPFPKNLEEAKELWRQRVRFDYLQEKLAREITETNGLIRVELSATNAAEIGPTLARHYRWSLRMMTNLSSDNVLQIYLNALAHAYDPHSDFFTAPKAQDFSIGMNLGLFGIGAQLTEDDGYCTIRELIHGGPAEKSKQIKPKDRVVAVAQGNQPPVDVVDMDLERVVQQIRGAKGTEVRLTISPADDRTARRVVTLIRDEIKLEDSEAKAKLVEIPDGHGGTNRIGIIDLPSFYAPVDMSGSGNRSTPRYTSVDVSNLIIRLKREKVSGIIIDLRSNPGGSLEEAIRFTGLFIKEGPIVLARNPNGEVQVDSDTDPAQLYNGPLVVMINRFSASASEIAAAALQDYGRAIVVGDISTHGKGTVQNLNPLRPFVRPVNGSATNDPGAVKITIRKFYRINGTSTQLKGVEPDIILPSVLNYSTQIGETALENPLPWDTIQPAAYDKLNLVQPYLAQIRTNSEARVASNQDFAYLRQDIEQFLKKQADKTATLNEHEAIKEREIAAAQSKTRETERTARQTPDVKVYEITMKNVDLPDLTEAPASDQATNPPALTKNLPALNQEHTAAAAKLAAVADKKSPPPFDPMLDEAERILVDYISLLSKNSAVTTNR
jgi:carboxyl-terminal processing protease